MSFRILMKDFGGISSGEITNNQLKALHEELQKVKPQDLESMDDHVAFLNILRSFRLAISENTDLVGRNFLTQITSLLGVGEDGVYSNRFRFLYELIQNVDDCDYDKNEAPKLDIRFNDINNEIQLTYNEQGFTPQNVFEITAIAGGTKNLDEKKIEIGEKGIGFKSVFGIADSVLIQSGMFSFVLNKNQFTIPQPYYDQGFSGVAGTRMTLRIKGRFVHEVYQELVTLYSTPSALLDRNPVLFLNKLSSIKFCVDDSFRYIVFKASREGVEKFGEEILISADIVHPNKPEVHNSIRCFRYKVKYEYGREACISRYGENTTYQNKCHQIIAVIPQTEELSKFGKKGVLYSFLPTQIKLSVPLLLHVPYKLDASREYVDSQTNNLWFSDTNICLAEFLRMVYSDLSGVVKEKIIYYLPIKSQYFFGDEHDKGGCLRIPSLRGDIMTDQSLFCCVDGQYRKSNDITSFMDLENNPDPVEIHTLLSIQKALFSNPTNKDLTGFGIDMIRDTYSRLLKEAIGHPSITARAFEILATVKNIDFIYEISNLGTFSIAQEQETAVLGCGVILAAFQTIANKNIKNGELPPFHWCSKFEPVQEDQLAITQSVLEDFDSKTNKVKNYLNRIGTIISSSRSVSKDDYLACDNALIVSQEIPLSSFSSFAEAFGMKSITAQLRMRQESIKLDDLVSDEKISNDNYLDFLRNVRKSLITILGINGYGNYVKVINDAGVDQNRFIKELLQNADDCNYSNHKDLPQFSCQFRGSSLITRCNENGFSKANVRSITAIGESTKKMILDNVGADAIGEKGVGFKSVFSVASEVSIHSNGFHFQLRDDRPTFPGKIDPSDSKDETLMLFRMKKPFTNDYFTEENVLSLCLCLRKLKVLQLGNMDVTIKDSDSSRTVFINDTSYTFQKHIHNFTIDDEKALANRRNLQRFINRNQEISLYVPMSNATKRALSRRFLYCGLPTSISQNVMLIIDAPFETSTSRENIIHNSWNSIIRNEVYKALISFLYAIRNDRKNELFEYVNLEKGLFSDEWLNNYPIVDAIAGEELVHLSDGTFRSPKKEKCWVYPEVCLYSLIKDNYLKSLNIVNMTRSLSYIWEEIGCQPAALQDIISVIEKSVEKKIMLDDTYRKLLYTWLYQNKQKIAVSQSLSNRLKQLHIVPIKPLNGTENTFISPENSIYGAPSENSTSEYYVLDEKIMSSAEYFNIYGKAILPMDNRLKLTLYREKLVDWIINYKDEDAAKHLLLEFSKNKGMMDACVNELKGRRNTIPVKYANGIFSRGNKYISTNREFKYSGDIIGMLLVAPEYQAFAEYIGCEDIRGIEYHDIDVTLDEFITTNDFNDFMTSGFSHRFEIVQGFIKDGKVPLTLITQNNLEALVNRSDDIGLIDQHEFPKRPVKDIDRLRKHISEKEFNEYINQQRTVRVTMKPFDRRTYTLQEYQCDQGVHICQLCGQVNHEKYFEAATIEYLPKYAWDQMQLCLCLNCGKDYDLYNRNRDIMSEFVSALLHANVKAVEPIEVPLVERHVKFTATHLAEVQEILKLQMKVIEGSNVL